MILTWSWTTTYAEVALRSKERAAQKAPVSPVCPMTTRRDVVAGAISLLFAGRAATQGRIFRLGYLAGSAPEPHSPTRRALFGRLEELGYREGQNLVVDRRYVEGRLDRLPALAAERQQGSG